MTLAKTISEDGVPERWRGTNSLEEDWQGKILRSWSSSESSRVKETGKVWDIGYEGTEFWQKKKCRKE